MIDGHCQIAGCRGLEYSEQLRLSPQELNALQADNGFEYVEFLHVYRHWNLATQPKWYTNSLGVSIEYHKSNLSFAFGERPVPSQQSLGQRDGLTYHNYGIMYPMLWLCKC